MELAYLRPDTLLNKRIIHVRVVVCFKVPDSSVGWNPTLIKLSMAIPSVRWLGSFSHLSLVLLPVLPSDMKCHYILYRFDIMHTCAIRKNCVIDFRETVFIVLCFKPTIRHRSYSEQWGPRGGSLTKPVGWLNEEVKWPTYTIFPYTRWMQIRVLTVW